MSEQSASSKAEGAALVASDEIVVKRELLESLLDSDPCWFDHHGGCRAHGFSLDQGELCPVEEAKRLLAAPLSEVETR